MASSSKATASSSDEDTASVFFWKETERPYGCFCQWYKHPFTETGENGESVTFATAEQYMMYHKALLFSDPTVAAEILRAQGGRAQRALGRKVHNFTEEAWAANRLRIVQDGNYLKFSQDPDLKQILLATGDREIVEASPRDRIWGVGYGAKNAPARRKDWGSNLLGKALMEARRRIQEEEGEDGNKG